MNQPNKCTITACKHYRQPNYGGEGLYSTNVSFVATFKMWGSDEKRITVIVPLSNN